MAYTLPGPGGEVWWWEEDLGEWRLISRTSKRRKSKNAQCGPDRGKEPPAGGREPGPPRAASNGAHVQPFPDTPFGEKTSSSSPSR